MTPFGGFVHPEEIMAEPFFSIHYDATTSTLEVVLQGFWDMGVQAEFVSALFPRLNTLRTSGAPFAVLFDLRRFSVQSMQIIEMMSAVDDPGALRRRAPAAVVLESALLRRQAARVLPSDSLRFFESVNEARDWIRSELVARRDEWNAVG